MITPNKVVTLENSVLGLVGVILEQGSDPIEMLQLYRIVSNKFESIDQFLLAIDVLHVLGRIEVNFQTRTIIYAI